MSRVGYRIIKIPENVEVKIDKNVFTVKGPLGELTKTFSNLIKIEFKNNEVTVKRSNEEKQTKMLHGTTNSLIQGMVTGVKEGFKKELEINGVGYNVKQEGTKLTFALGYSHKINVEVPSYLSVEVLKPTALVISGIDKQKVGEFSSKLKKLKPPEPYGGKGIKYKGEHIIRKVGKKA